MIVKTHLSRHNRRAMQLRIVGLLCQTLIRSHSAFQRTEPRGHERHRWEAYLGDRALANESNALERPRFHRAFTLIELLVVIAIIAVLIGLLFPAFRAVQDQAKRTQAKNDLTQIVNAVNAYYTDYGQYPCASQNGNDGADFVAADDNSENVLMDNLRSRSPTLNPRQIVFLSPPNVKDPNAPRSGIGADFRFYDPWGKAYRVKIDNNYNGTLTNAYTADTGAGPATLNTGVIAWSVGKDQTQGTNFNASDDVISWQ
jgi:prepilin-type N-terminal cleavage/methylation domain-containing protein